MRKTIFSLIGGITIAMFTQGCSENKSADPMASKDSTVAEKPNYGGYASQVEWGAHLVTLGGCNDCHTPKKMTPMGPADDSTLLLSGHPEKMPAAEIDRKMVESKGLVVTNTFTSWIGPWGISYSANLTPDETGIGNWTEDQFVYALKNKVSKGLPGARPLLPPMSMMPAVHMEEAELRAIFAYLKTVKPIKNLSVQPTPPVMAPKKS